MNQKKNRGFTLIELLAVIVILAIIALIAVPIIMNIISKANESAFKDTAYGIISAGELYFAERQLDPNGMQEDITFNLPDERLQLKGEIPEGSITITKEGKVALAVYNNRYCVTKGIEDKDVKVTENYEFCVIPGFEKLITNLELSESSVEIYIDKQPTVTIFTTISPSDATYKALIWQSSNENVASVSNGVITAKGEGTAIITATTKDGSNISKSVEVNVIRIYTNDIITATNNCINTGACVEGTKVQVAVNNTDTYNFYVIADTGSELTLIMDSNLGERVAWYLDDDNSTKVEKNNLGPVTALNYLNNQTSNWSNIEPIVNYTYDDNSDDATNTDGYQKLEITNGVGKILSREGTLTELVGVSRARLLTSEEKSNLKQLNNNVNPQYLYTNLSSSNTTETQIGYWHLTAFHSKNMTNQAYLTGYLVGNTAVFDEVGVRPVITVKK